MVNAHDSLYALQTATPLAADSKIEFRAFLGHGLNIRNVRLTSDFNGEVGLVKAAQCSSINGAMARPCVCRRIRVMGGYGMASSRNRWAACSGISMEWQLVARSGRSPKATKITFRWTAILPLRCRWPTR
jgi:hypothetical protein